MGQDLAFGYHVEKMDGDLSALLLEIEQFVTRIDSKNGKSEVIAAIARRLKALARE